MTIAAARAWVVLLVMALACGVALGQERVRGPETGGERTVDLRPKFREGQTVRLKMEVTNSAKPARQAKPSPRTTPRSADEPAPETDSRIEFGLTMKVESVSPEKEATVAMTFDTVKVSSRVGGESFEFDSTKPSKEGDMIGLMMKPLVGTTLTLKVDKDGNVTSVSGGEAFTAIGQAVSGGTLSGDLLGPIFSPRHGKGLVRVGESWENEDRLESPLLGRFRMITKHTLKRVSGADAHVDVSGRIDAASEGEEAEPFQIKDSRYSGAYTWDTEMGMVKQMDTTMRVTIEQTIGGQKTTMQNESVMKVSRIR